MFPRPTVLLPSLLVAALIVPAFADPPLEPVPFPRVQFEDGFWAPRLETNRRVTIGYTFEKCEETGRIANFARAGGLEKGGFEGIPYNDSDVFKVMEGAAYSLAANPDSATRQLLEAVIAKVAAAQEDDGYLYTARTLGFTNAMTGPARWSNLRSSHELYNVGHMYEAAVAHYQLTAERTFLEIALRNAALIDRTFGREEGKRRDVPGHEEIELGLLKLYRATGDPEHLELARFFLELRGNREPSSLYGEYAQDHLPVTEQTQAVGHAVRAGYLYSAIAEIAALTSDRRWRDAVDRIWDDVVQTKLYITGGIGARRSGEAFGDSFELPNESAYNETCAAIANALWNHRMFLLHGSSDPIDVLERVIYNGFLVGVSLGGDRFFYPNPLSCSGHVAFNQGSRGRSPWFSCSCCPVNIVRFVPSLPGYVYATRNDSIHVNLYVAGSAEIDVEGTPVRIRQETDYPWDGRIRITVDPPAARALTLRLRIPGWARNQPVPSDLYRYLTPTSSGWSVTVNGSAIPPALERGYAVIRRTWKPGDEITLTLPLSIRRVVAHDKVAADRGHVALGRGPIVYCIEAADHGGRVSNLALPDGEKLTAHHRPDLLGGVVTLEGSALAVARDAAGKITTKKTRLEAIPYYAWAHRELGEMTVWIPRDPALTRPALPPTIASESRPSASHVWASDSVEALNDRREPASSADHSIPRFTWWNHRGTSEWVEYAFAQPTRVSAVEVYWFDDTGIGRCRVPASWALSFRDGAEWRRVETEASFGVEKDRYNVVSFTPVETTALRIEVALRPEFSGGILEWKVR